MLAGEFCSHKHKTAVYNKRGAGSIGCPLRGEKGDEGGYFTGMAGASEWQVGALDGVRVRILISGHRRGNLSGSYGINRDAERGKLHRHNLRQKTQTPLRSAIG